MILEFLGGIIDLLRGKSKTETESAHICFKNDAGSGVDAEEKRKMFFNSMFENAFSDRFSEYHRYAF